MFARVRRSAQRTLHTRPSVAYTRATGELGTAVTTSPDGLSSKQRRMLDAALRVDHAGELAANWIYRGQLAVLGKDADVGPLIQVGPSNSHRALTKPTTQKMWDQEKHHLAVMDRLQVQHRVRPTMLSHVAKTVGYGLGVATALMGRQAAMACTEAVETVIGEHYDE